MDRTEPIQRPRVLAMVVCEYVHVNPGTLSRTILNTFSFIYGEAFPLEVAQMAVYAALTDGRGETTVVLTVDDADDNRLDEFTCEHELLFDDPVAVKEVQFSFKPFTVDQPGELRIQLSCEGEVLIERRLYVREA